MSADLLRRAASLMRDRAEAATPGPWAYAADDTDWVIWMPDAGHDGAMVEAEPDASHIAGMHPGVALAMADWLDATAALHDQFVSDGLARDFDVVDTDRQALAVARAYLGGSA